MCLSETSTSITRGHGNSGCLAPALSSVTTGDGESAFTRHSPGSQRGPSAAARRRAGAWRLMDTGTRPRAAARPHDVSWISSAAHPRMGARGPPDPINPSMSGRCCASPASALAGRPQQLVKRCCGRTSDADLQVIRAIILAARVASSREGPLWRVAGNREHAAAVGAICT
jgi:hypothetical protein